MAYEYHFWCHLANSISGKQSARLIHEDVRLYEKNGLNGIIEDGTQRPFFPNGLTFYTYARTLFDTSLSFEEIEEDYLSHAYGDDWRRIRDYLYRIEDALPYTFLARREAEMRANGHYDPEMAKRIGRVPEITKSGRPLIESNYNSEYRVRTVMIRLLEKHARFAELISEWIAAKARGEIETSKELLEKAKAEMGKFEPEIEKYYDHALYFNEYTNNMKTKPMTPDDFIV